MDLSRSMLKLVRSKLLTSLTYVTPGSLRPLNEYQANEILYFILGICVNMCIFCTYQFSFDFKL
ncbi:hypothetical protein Hanom_Chr00s157505g01824131 [Helianthus anomalus]